MLTALARSVHRLTRRQWAVRGQTLRAKTTCAGGLAVSWTVPWPGTGGDCGAAVHSELGRERRLVNTRWAGRMWWIAPITLLFSSATATSARGPVYGSRKKIQRDTVSIRFTGIRSANAHIIQCMVTDEKLFLLPTSEGGYSALPPTFCPPPHSPPTLMQFSEHFMQVTTRLPFSYFSVLCCHPLNPCPVKSQCLIRVIMPTKRISRNSYLAFTTWVNCVTFTMIDQLGKLQLS